MRPKIVFFLLIVILSACNENEHEPEPDPCHVLVDGVYVYPGLADANIPEEILDCITTEGLVATCFNTPNALSMMAHDGYQWGYEYLKKGNRGFDELERRDDSPGYLIAKYKSIELSDTAEYEIFFIRYRLHLFEVLISQSSILEKMSVNEKYELINIALDYYKVKRSREGDDRELLRDGTLVILGRLMVFDSYLPFIGVCESDENISRLLVGRETSDIEKDKAEIIIEYAESYLN